MTTIPTYNEAALKLELKKLDASLRCVLDHCGVIDNDQAHLAHIGITSLRRAGALYGDTAATAKAEAAILGWNAAALTGDQRLEMTVRIADLVSAFKEATIHADRESKERANAITSEVPQPIRVAHHQELKLAIEEKHGKLDKNEVPSRWFQAQKSEQVAENTPSVEQLTDVTSKEDGEEAGFLPELNSDGKLTIKKGPMKKVPLPRDPEELRNKHRLICNAWLMADAMHHSRTWLQGLTPRVYEKYTDYLVGGRVHKLPGAVVHWDNVLNYDFEMRQFAYETVSEDNNVTIADALKKAMNNVELRQIHFIEKLTLNSRRPANSQTWTGQHKTDNSVFNPMDNKKGQNQAKGPTYNQGKDKMSKGRNKGKSKNKTGKGKGGKGMKPKLNRTPDGTPICFKYNNAEGACDGGCGMTHVCQYCQKTDCAVYKCKDNKL